jgi:hypothetical protein
MVAVLAVVASVKDMDGAEELVKDQCAKSVRRLVIALEDARSILIVSSR